jgi:hypothetical protein
MKRRDCLDCGFIAVHGETNCPKCDAVLSAQTDGSWAIVDIAHDRETIRQATDKLDLAIRKHLAGHTQYLRVVIGRGRIQSAIWPHLSSLQKAGRIQGFAEEARNRGAVVVTLRCGSPRVRG